MPANRPTRCCENVRVLLLSSVFPNASQPTLGVFVRERARRMALQCAIEVVAPVPWFPVNRLFRGAAAGAPLAERDGDVPGYHPRFFSTANRSLSGLCGLDRPRPLGSWVC